MYFETKIYMEYLKLVYIKAFLFNCLFLCVLLFIEEM